MLRRQFAQSDELPFGEQLEAQAPAAWCWLGRNVIATSLLDPGVWSHDELAELYGARWHAELDLRSLKETLQMDVLRCKTPELVRAEIWTHLLAYNLVRTVMAQAASPR